MRGEEHVIAGFTKTNSEQRASADGAILKNSLSLQLIHQLCIAGTPIQVNATSDEHIEAPS